MSLPVTVVIASLDDERWIGAAIDSARGAEVIVSDGGSADSTREIAAAHGARVIAAPPMRSRQFNAGAAAAGGEIVIFLHADTTLPAGAIDAVQHAADFGGFRIAFAEPSLRLRLAAALINARTLLTKCPWGDQAQFIRRSIFLDGGGFREIPLMEDYDLAQRMKRRSTILPLTVTTSGRRFLRLGLIRTALTNWTLVARWRLGTDAETLARIYRSTS